MGSASPEFDAWFARCVARDRSLRYQSIREAAADLAAVANVQAPMVDRPSHAERAQSVLQPPSAQQCQSTIIVEAAAGSSVPPNFTLTHPPATLVSSVRKEMASRRWMLGAVTGAVAVGGVVGLSVMIFGGAEHARVDVNGSQTQSAATMNPGSVEGPIPVPSMEPLSAATVSTTRVELSITPIEASAAKSTRDDSPPSNARLQRRSAAPVATPSTAPSIVSSTSVPRAPRSRTKIDLAF